MRATTREIALDDARVALDSAKIGTKKFFWISSLNRVDDDRIPIGIERIAPKPIRMRAAPCDREDEHHVSNRRPKGPQSDDSTDRRAIHATLRRARARRHAAAAPIRRECRATVPDRHTVP